MILRLETIKYKINLIMKKNIINFRTALALCLLLSTTLAISCKKNNNSAAPVDQTTKSQLTEAEEIRIMKAGFSTNDAKKVGNSYLVEGDILLSAEDLTNQIKLIQELNEKNGPATEQYKSGYRLANKFQNGVLKVKVDAGSMQKLVTEATTIALKRYNDQQLLTTFKIITTGTADIVVVMKNLGGPQNGSITAGQAAGFPSADGTPAPQFSLNNQYYNDKDFTATDIANVIAHEIGHCIGFRHSDYKTRGSCPDIQAEPVTDYKVNAEQTQYLLDNNGNRIPDLTTTATLIPGTLKSDPNSWMRACNAPGAFSFNDITALRYLLGH